MKRLALALTTFAIGSAAALAAEPRFADRSADIPVQHEYNGGWEHFVGGGVAVLDCNNDRFPDAYLAGGENPARLLVNATGKAGDAIRFTAPDSPQTALTGVTGAYPLDFDSDGQMDLFVMRVGENHLLRGLPGCRFEDAGPAYGFSGSDRWTASFSATWETGNTLPTLAVGNYVDREDPEGPFGTCDSNELHRPTGNRYGEPLKLEPGYCALSMLFSDWTRTGRRDLRISNDRHYYLSEGEEQMFRLDEMRFLDERDGWDRISIWGMGIASQDLNSDGWPDLMLTSMGDQLIQFVESGTHLVNAPFSIGAYAHRPYVGDDGRPSTGWHAQFGDVDNDGLVDLFIAKGNVDQMPSNAMKDPNNMLMQQGDGTFVERGMEAGLANPARSRGAALADFNLDGRLDVAVVNRRAPFEIHENVTEGTGNFLLLDVRMPDINRQAVGSWVELKTSDGKSQSREIVVGGGHAGGQAVPVHFGIGSNESASVRVIWPDGKTSEWKPVEPGRLQVLMRDGETAGFTVSPALN